MNMVTICSLTALSISIMICITAIIIAHILVKDKKEDRRVNKEIQDKMFLQSININDSNFELLDNIISNEVQSYYIYTFPHKIDGNDKYLSKAEQDIMIKGVMTNILKKLSPVLLHRLSLIYNEDVLEDIIYEKVASGVLALSIENNGTYIKN